MKPSQRGEMSKEAWERRKIHLRNLFEREDGEIMNNQATSPLVKVVNVEVSPVFYFDDYFWPTERGKERKRIKSVRPAV